MGIKDLEHDLGSPMRGDPMACGQLAAGWVAFGTAMATVSRVTI
jgi:hypothetical protein